MLAQKKTIDSKKNKISKLAGKFGKNFSATLFSDRKEIILKAKENFKRTLSAN